jgi:predicted dehydrogenase
MNPFSDQQTSRRDFIKTTGAAAIGGVIASNLIFPQRSFAENSNTIRIGLIGCGGRGSGNVREAMTADPNCVLVAMGDAFQDALDLHLDALKKTEFGDRIKVTKDTSFVGFDAYRKVVDHPDVDVVFLATPPGFRSIHIKYAIEQGKHVFCEKPICTDAFGYRSFIETVKEAKRKNLGIGSGFCWRSNLAQRAAYEKILGGEIGDVRTIYGTYLTGAPRFKEPDPAWGPMEAQLRNWMHFVWLSGDHIVEQCIHNVDLTNWAMKNEMPVKCIGTGGRQIRPENMVGHIYDHFAITYEWANGVKGFVTCRQQPGCASDNTEHVYGTKGTAHILLFNGVPYITDLQNKKVWKYDGEKNNPNMYVVEQKEFLQSLRTGKPRMDGEWLANSSMMGVMGRMAAYTGQEITWEEAKNSKEKLVPDEKDIVWDKAPPVPPLAIPGKTRFI